MALPPEARAAVALYRAGEGNAASLAANLEAIRKKVDADPRLARGSAGVQYRHSLDYLIGQTSEVTTLAREGVSAQAYDRLLQGDRKSGGKGERGAVRVDLGLLRTMKKKNAQ